MSNEANYEVQYDIPLASIVDGFNRPNLRDGSNIVPVFPEYIDSAENPKGWHGYSNRVGESLDMVFEIQRENRIEPLNGIDMFEAFWEKVRDDKFIDGRKSLLLFSLFTKGDGRNDQLLDEVWDENNTPINPPFKVGDTDLPANIRIRNTLLEALTIDRDYFNQSRQSANANWATKLIDVLSAQTTQKPLGRSSL